WIDAVIATPELLWEKKTKSGKETIINLRDRLFALTLESQSDKKEKAVILSYVGSCRNDGTFLQPEQVVYMLEFIAQQEFHLLEVHRQQMMFISC
ncbi:MAG: DUF2344 domain-containing protein, partial [Microcystaceae cyanobacterium]